MKNKKSKKNKKTKKVKTKKIKKKELPPPQPRDQHPYGDPIGTRDDPQAVYDPRCYGE